MSIHQITSEYIIDLQKPEEDRWNEVIQKEGRTAKALIRNAAQDSLEYDPTSETPGLLSRALIKFIADGFKFSGGHYQGELKAWAKAVNVTPAELTFLNCQYELSHLFERTQSLGQRVPEWLRKMVGLGCTAGAVRLGTERVVHVRNMDWPLEYMGKATRIFRFIDGDREFVTVGVPGMVGVLSGMMPGRYSVTINYAPPTFMPGFDFGPLFLLRHVFETCNTYEETCYALSHTKLSANVIFMVCSAHGQACTIERTRNAFAKVSMRGGTLTVANHYRSRKFVEQNKGWDPDIIVDSKERASVLASGLKGLGRKASLEQVACVLDADPVFNEETCQMMVFDTSRGELLVWAG